VPGALSLEVKRPGRETDYPPPSHDEVKECWIHTSTPSVRLHGVVNFTLVLVLFDYTVQLISSSAVIVPQTTFMHTLCLTSVF